jgi:transcriptional regulator with XRE-family HTH domain
VNQWANQGNRASTVLGRRLGAELLRLRDAAGKTQQQAAAALSATGTKIVKMERGWVPMRDPDIRALCEFYGLNDPGTRDRLLSIAKLDRERRKSKGWWQHLPRTGALNEYVAMEDVASRVRTWQLSYIPGLFQTADYQRAQAVGEGCWEDPDEIERFVEIRRKRQQRLYSERPLHVYAVIWEAALRQLIGGPTVMRGQLAHLLQLAELPHIQLQILPFRAGAHACAPSPFSIISFTDADAVDVIYMDTIGSAMWAENPTDSARCSAFFERTARQALAPHDSAALISSIRKEL